MSRTASRKFFNWGRHLSYTPINLLWNTVAAAVVIQNRAWWWLLALSLWTAYFTSFPIVIGWSAAPEPPGWLICIAITVAWLLFFGGVLVVLVPVSAWWLWLAGVGVVVLVWHVWMWRRQMKRHALSDASLVLALLPPPETPYTES